MVTIIVSIVAVLAFIVFTAYVREIRDDMSEEIDHLTKRVDNLMECVREFNQKLKDYERSR